MNLAIIDFEFTGLDSTHYRDNEILETKIAVVDDDFNVVQAKIWIHKTDKQNGIGSMLINGITSNEQTEEKFSADWFQSSLAKMGITIGGTVYGFGVSTDVRMLEKYGVNIGIVDIQEMMSATEEYGALMAEHGRSMETCHAICTGTVKRVAHKGTDELYMIAEIAKRASVATPINELTVMPWGFARGMPIDEYVVSHRRNADGYRFHNSDILAQSLTAEIERQRVIQEEYMDDGVDWYE